MWTSFPQPRPRFQRRYLPAEEETYFATAWIWAGLSLPWNAGIAPPPTITWWATTDVLGLSWSRFGPTVPVALAAASVWQPAQPAPLKMAAPSVPRLANPPPALKPPWPATEAT